MFRLEKKTAISDACYAELKTLESCKHLVRYPVHETKVNGLDEGVILKGTRKNGLPKTTYAKKIAIRNGNDQIDEFLLMIAAKTCGVLTPKIKIKPAGKNIFYQFARDLSDPSFANHQGSVFQTLEELKNPHKAYQLTANNAVIHRDCMHDSNQRININKHSLAMLVVAALVFDFRDVHVENVGIVISPSEKTAQYAVVDLSNIPNVLASIKLGKYTSLANLVQTESDCKKFFRELPVACLTNDELSHALDVIAANFKNACTAVQAQAACYDIHNMLPADHVSNMITRWERNLDTLKLFAIDPRLVANLR